MKNTFSLVVLFLLLATSNLQAQRPIKPPKSSMPIDSLLWLHVSAPNIKPFFGDCSLHDMVIIPYASDRNSRGGYYLPGKKNGSEVYYSYASSPSDPTNTYMLFLGACWGDIGIKYFNIGHVQSVLGWPLNDETAYPDGVGYFQNYQNGTIYWHPKFGAHVVQGAIYLYWTHNNEAFGPLGYPIEDQIDFKPPPGNAVKWSTQKFVGGVVTLTQGGLIQVKYSGNNNPKNNGKPNTQQ